MLDQAMISQTYKKHRQQKQINWTSKLKIFVLQRTKKVNYKKEKKKQWEEIFPNHMSDMGLITEYIKILTTQQ